MFGEEFVKHRLCQMLRSTSEAPRRTLRQDVDEVLRPLRGSVLR